MIRRVVAAASLTVCLTGCGAPPEAGPSAPAAPVRDPLAVLHAWDAERARAWEHGDPDALTALYLPGARVGVEDVALLERYRERGVRLGGLRMQVLAARTLVDRPTRLRVEVVERFAGGWSRSGTQTRALPRGVPVRRVVELRRYAERWVAADIRQSPRAAPR